MSTYRIIEGECVRCGACVDSCPVEAILEGGFYVRAYYIDPDRCTGCAACVDTCPLNLIVEA